MYDLVAYEMMLADAVRTDAYLAAIAGTVRPGDVVVEIGTGVGYFAVAAVRAGARHVYAIETNPVITLGPAVAEANGCADRITFMAADSRRVSVPELGDVLLADLRGMLPLAGHNIPSIIDARERLLKPDARFVSIRDILWASPVELGAVHARHYLAADSARYGIRRDPVERAARSFLSRLAIERSELLAAPATWGSIDFPTVTSPDVVGVAEWTVDRGGRVDGIGVWFDAELGSGAGISNAPGTPVTSYGRGLLPLRSSVEVDAGDRIRVALRAKLVDADYIFGWDTTVEPADDRRNRVFMRQSTLDTLLLRPEQLRRRRSDHRPQLGESTRVLADLIALADGSRSFAEIARRLRERHPDTFRTDKDALHFATERSAALEDGDLPADPTLG